MTLHKQSSITKTKTKHHSVNEASTQSPLRTRFPLHHPTPNPAHPNKPYQKPPKAKPFTPHPTHTHTQSTKHTLRNLNSSPQQPPTQANTIYPQLIPTPNPATAPPPKNSYPACVSLKHRTCKHCSFPRATHSSFAAGFAAPGLVFYDKRRCWRSVVALLPDCG